MNTYNIELDTEVKYKSSDGTPATEEEVLLQIWQDLKKLDSTQMEDKIIFNLLQQIMVQKYGTLENVPYPEYYEKSDD